MTYISLKAESTNWLILKYYPNNTVLIGQVESVGGVYKPRKPGNKFQTLTATNKMEEKPRVRPQPRKMLPKHGRKCGPINDALLVRTFPKTHALHRHSACITVYPYIVHIECHYNVLYGSYRMSYIVLKMSSCLI